MARICCTVLLVLLVGCSQSYYSQGKGQLNRGEYDKAIENFYKEIQTDPKSADAWRSLGIAFYQQGDAVKAEDALLQAANIAPQVAETQVYLGLVHEKQGNLDKAISSYSQALNLGAGGEMEKKVRGRLDALLAERMKQEVQQALAGESAIKPAEIPENTIAVTDFDGSDLQADMQPIAKGMAELTAIDLSKVNALTVLERRKLDVLQQEIELGSTGRVDVGTAPRVGRLLGSRRVVTGKITTYGDNQLRLDGVLINTVDSTVANTKETEGQLQKFFDIQKAFVFGLLESMNIEITQAERDAISEVPTESFLAFLAYSRGLDYESRGLYKEAQQEFGTALQHDQSFEQANTELNAVTATGTVESFEGTVLPATGGITTAGLDNFQQITVTNSGFVPTGQTTPNSTTIQPPVVGTTGHVIIRGTTDGN